MVAPYRELLTPSIVSMSSLPNTHEEIASPFLSRIAESFQERMSAHLSDQVLDGSTYKETFTGRVAVDQLAIVLHTSDRQLALRIGRSLNAQGLFRGPKEEHNPFEDSEEIYQFGGAPVNGVWTLLSKCYSPSCSDPNGPGLYKCYSAICPRGPTAEQRSRY